MLINDVNRIEEYNRYKDKAQQNTSTVSYADKSSKYFNIDFDRIS